MGPLDRSPAEQDRQQRIGADPRCWLLHRPPRAIQRISRSDRCSTPRRSGEESISDGPRFGTAPDPTARAALRRPAGRPADVRADISADRGGDGTERTGAGRPGGLPGHRGHPRPDAGPPDPPPVRCSELVTAVARHRRRDGRCGWSRRPAGGRCGARGDRGRLRRRQHRPQGRRPTRAARPRLGRCTRCPEGADAGVSVLPLRAHRIRLRLHERRRAYLARGRRTAGHAR